MVESLKKYCEFNIGGLEVFYVDVGVIIDGIGEVIK